MVERIRAGDDSALAAVYDRYSAVVHGIAARCVGPDRANDVTQEVFLHLWWHPDSFAAERGGLREFLAVIARRRAIDLTRATERRTRREQRAVAEAAPAAGSPEDTALASVLAERVRAAVARLPVEQRRAIELAYFGGLTFRDVARAMSTAEGTAKSRLRLGLGRLAKELQRQPVGGGAAGWN